MLGDVMAITAMAAPKLDRAPGSLVLTHARSASCLDTMGDLIDDVAEADRAIARAAAKRAALIDQARSWSEATASLMPTDVSQVHRWSATRVARRSLVSELAAALQLPERTTENLIEESRSLLRELPATMTALAEGDISYRHAQVMIDHANSLPIDARRPFERAALPFALTLTASRFDSRAHVLRERVHPESIEVRHTISRDKRELSVDSARDGMAWLTAYLPAASVQAIYNRVADVAAGLHSPDEPRTLTQLRADVFCDLLIDGVTAESHPTHPNLGTGVRARVLVTVPVLTLLGRSAEPAVLEGYGPIDIDTARELAAGAPVLCELSPTRRPVRCSPSVATATRFLQTSARGFACGMRPAGPRDAVPPLGAAISTIRRIGSITVSRTTTISRTSARNTTTRSTTPGGPSSISARVTSNGSHPLVTGTDRARNPDGRDTANRAPVLINDLY